MEVVYVVLSFIGMLCIGTILGFYIATKALDAKLKTFFANMDNIIVELLRGVEEQTVNMVTEILQSQQPTAPPFPTKMSDLDEVERSAANPPPPKPIMEKMEQVGLLSKEISEMAMALDGPLKNSVDAKHRRGMVTKIKAKQEEVQKIMNEVVNAGYNPKIVMIDQHGNKMVKKLSDVIGEVTKGPEPLKPFDDEDLPNLGLVTEEQPQQQPDKE